MVAIQAIAEAAIRVARDEIIATLVKVSKPIHFPHIQ
jgi:hypothetical protein